MLAATVVELKSNNGSVVGKKPATDVFWLEISCIPVDKLNASVCGVVVNRSMVGKTSAADVFWVEISCIPADELSTPGSVVSPVSVSDTLPGGVSPCIAAPGPARSSVSLVCPPVGGVVDNKSVVGKKSDVFWVKSSGIPVDELSTSVSGVVNKKSMGGRTSAADAFWVTGSCIPVDELSTSVSGVVNKKSMGGRTSAADVFWVTISCIPVDELKASVCGVVDETVNSVSVRLAVLSEKRVALLVESGIVVEGWMSGKF